MDPLLFLLVPLFVVGLILGIDKIPIDIRHALGGLILLALVIDSLWAGLAAVLR